MLGCSDIIKKLRNFPVQKTATTLIVDTALNAGLGCLASVCGANFLGLNRNTAAQMGAAGNAVFGASRSMAISTYNHFTNAEVKSDQEGKQQKTVQEQPKKNLCEGVSSFFSSHVIRKIETEAEWKPLEDKKESPQPVDYAATVGKGLFVMGKYISYGILGNMLGYAMLGMPSSFSLGQAVTTTTIGSSMLVALPVFIAAVALCAASCSEKCVDASDICMDIICCDDDKENQGRSGLRR